MRRHGVYLAALLLSSTARAAYCPCYTATSQYNTYNCGVDAVAGANPTAAQWQPIFALICQGPAVWGSAGPTVGKIGSGCGMPTPLHSVEASFPIEILKGIAMQESGWRQFCNPTTPADQSPNPSRTIISFDCGYGVGQVTSGMHKGETPGFDRTKVAGDPTYNMATGTQILASKWIATNCVGDNDPKIVEDWYTAVWAYNGLAYVNNPNNPNYAANRGVWNPSVGGAAPYQEKVFGWIEHPPSKSYWTSVPLAYPNRADVGTSGAPPNLPEPACASPTNCAQKRAVHTTACGPQPPTADLGAGPVDADSPADSGAADDGFVPAVDAASTGDGGSATMPGGCACSLGARGRPAPAIAFALLVAIALLRRRAGRP